MSTHRLLLATLSFAVVSCADPTAPVPEPAASVWAPGHRVVGSGHVHTPAGLREFTFHSVEHPNGDVTGSFKVVLPNGLFFEADVTCMAVEGNTGWVAGTIRDTNAAAVIVGTRSLFYAIDGGEGASATDIVSIAAFNVAAGGDLAFCDARPLALPPLTVTAGNVQVR